MGSGKILEFVSQGNPGEGICVTPGPSLAPERESTSSTAPMHGMTDNHGGIVLIINAARDRARLRTEAKQIGNEVAEMIDRLKVLLVP